jgi:hypothetical protein
MRVQYNLLRNGSRSESLAFKLVSTMGKCIYNIYLKAVLTVYSLIFILYVLLF